VDVKKVLVIGSGGLSIGQAGEFDYSGEYERKFRISSDWTRIFFSSRVDRDYTTGQC
jgi:hypothetical protein